MTKSKLGISVSLLAAATWLLGYYGGYVITGLAVGYILLKEEDEWLKKMAARTIVMMLAFSVASTVINLIPTALNVIYSFVQIFNADFYIYFIDRIFNFLSTVLSVVKLVVFLGMGFIALTGKEFKIPVLDKWLDKLLSKHMA